ncbi:hypothetical protein HWV62_29336 [Athelia sp. TMB]|nr:hypothetical protein HWV62_29336 [Athelia sp. TMB]
MSQETGRSAIPPSLKRSASNAVLAGPSGVEEPGSKRRRVQVLDVCEPQQTSVTTDPPSHSNAWITYSAPEGPQNTTEDLMRPALAFNTSNTSGGTIMNVAGDYNDYRLLDEQLASMKIASALDKLSYADGASWNPTLACLPGTRVSTLAAIHRWLHLVDHRNILWLKGVAGSGKSAVAHTIAQALYRNGFLTSSFFFDREISTCNTPLLLFTTIARDIARLYPAIAADIGAALEQEPALVSAHISRQFEAFIAGPLRHHPVDQQIVVVIDALDEAIRDDLDTDLLAILRDEFAKLPPSFRVLITSRSTKIIEHHLSGKPHIAHHHIDINSAENRQDIATYVDAQLQASQLRSQIGTSGPDEALIRDLKVMAEGLFIWIATVFRYLDLVSNPKKKLRALLSRSHAQGQEPEPIRKIDALYSTILEASGDWDDEDFRDEYALFMGSVMAIKRPLSLAALRALHGGNQELSLGRLPQRFGAVLVGLHKENEPIHTLHLSFREFITGRAAGRAETQKFFLSAKEHSQTLGKLCIQMMVRELTDAPIAGTGYLARNQSGRPGIPELTGVSEQLLYGCEHWGDHVCDIESPTLSFTEILRKFLPNFNTTWIEIVASTSTFAGSLSVWRWLHVGVYLAHATELTELYDDVSQAQALFSLSYRLEYVGRLEEALSAIDDSVQLRRALAAQQPTIFGTKLADSLHNLSCHLSDLGRHEEALTAIQEAVEVYRPLAAEQPAIFNANLALSLNNLSYDLSDHSRHEEALAAIQEAVGLRRALAAERPAGVNADLAVSLNTLSLRLSNHGRHEEALAAIQEAVGLRRALAAERPAAFNADLAESLNNLAIYLSNHGRHAEALAAIQEAVGLRRALAAERPAAFNADLATSLNNLAIYLSNHGRHAEALAAIQEAVGLRRALAAERPEAFNAVLASSLNNLSNHLSDHGRHEEALVAIQEAVGLYRALAAERSAAFNAELAASLNNLSNRLSDHGRHEEALAASQEAVGLYRALAAERPAAFNADLAQSLYNLSFDLSSFGRHEDALEVIQESTGLYRALAAERPKVFTSDLSNALKRLSRCLSASGREEEAQIILDEAQSLSS